MMRSLFSGVSGLKNHQTRMDVIGNNISNVNTTGFKSSRVNFTDMLSQNLQGASSPNGNLGGTNPKQIGLGSAVGAVDLLFTNGSVQSTGVNTDLALSSSNALFVLDTGSGTAYTRNGDFQFDADGNYVQAGNGYFVQGWMADKSGSINTSSKVTGITIPSGKSMEPTASKIANYTNNLNAEVPTITSIMGGEVISKDKHIYEKKDDGTLTASEDFPVTISTDGGSKFTVTEGAYQAQTAYTITDGQMNSGSKVKVTAGESTFPGTAGGPYTCKTGSFKIGDGAATGITTGTMSGSSTNPLTVEVYGTTTSFNPVTGTYSVFGTTGKTDTVYTTSNSVSITGSSAHPAYVTCGPNPTYSDISGTACIPGQNYVIGTGGHVANGSMASSDTYGVMITTQYGAVPNSDKSGATLAVNGTSTYTYDLPAGSTVTLPDSNATQFYYYLNGDTTNPIPFPSSATGTFKDDGTSNPPGSTTDYITGLRVESVITKLEGAITSVGADVKTLSAPITSLSDEITKLEQEYATSADASADKPITLTLSDGSKITETSGRYAVGHSIPVVTTLPVYDTLGSVHEIAVYFTLTNAENDTWEVSLSTDGLNPSTTSWKETDGSTTKVSMPVVTLDFDTNGAYASGAGRTTMTLTNGSTTPQTIQLDFTQLTQYSSSSTIAGKADGNAAGTLSSIAIDKTGVITGTYTNGEKRAEAQIALQRFTNPGGLTKVGESLYEDSNNAGKSGEPSTAATLGATITPSALEMSNVDIANEFTDMIITQRGFQGNSKIITVSDEMLETLINLKR